MISQLAHIDPEAKIGKNVTIHPFVFISKNVEIGDDCVIYPYASILSGARIGKRTKIYNGAIIAAEPQDFRWKGENTFCYIGNDCKIREHSIINRGISPEGGTRIGNKVFLMAETHVSHDAVIEDQCVLGNGVQVAGNSIVHSHVILSSGVMIHSNSDIADWVMVKGGCRISGNVPPYVVMAHNPVQYFGVNAEILRHCHFSESSIDNIAKSYRHVYESNTSTFNALRRIDEDIEPSPERDAITNFIKSHNLKIVAVQSHADLDN